MTDATASADPWAWARESAVADASVDVSAADVTAVVVVHQGERWLPSLLDSLQALTLRPTSVVVVDAGSADDSHSLATAAQASGRVTAVVAGRRDGSFGENAAIGLEAARLGDWLWFLHDDAVVDADSLARLVTAALQRPAAVVGPLLIEPRRKRGRAARVSELGQTITDDGTITGVVMEGTVDQGQFEGGPVLGVNTCGMLARRSVWQSTGGFDEELPSTVQGLEFCWRARLAGHSVVTEPRARVVHYEASTRGLREGVVTDPQQDRRRWGLTFHEAFRDGVLSAGERGRLRAASTRRVLGFLVGKDLLDARLERRAVRDWRTDRESVGRLRAAYMASVAGHDAAGSSGVEGLRLNRKAQRGRRVDEAFGRLTDWLSAFGDRGGGMGLDALTGDDFARDDQTRRRLSPTWIAFWVLVVGALVASRGLLSGDPLAGPQLLHVPNTFGALLGTFLDPVAGVTPSSGAPWTGLLWVVSLITLGHPDLVLSLLLLGAVPLCFLLARRCLGRLVDDAWVALLGALLYALVPVWTGAVSSGQWGTVAWAVALPVLANLLLTWWDDRDPAWPVAGGVGLASMVMTAMEPTTWVAVAVALLLLGRRGGGWPRVAVAGLAPAILLATPFTVELVRFPGRLLTGVEPLLAPSAAPSPLDLLLGRTSSLAPPLWGSAVFFGICWALALTGAALKRNTAAWGVAAAVGAVAIAVGLTRVVVSVPPTGLQARPQASAWIVGAAWALLWAAVTGLDGLRETIAEHTFDRRHLLVYVTAALALVAVVGGLGWWAVDGHAGLQRRASSSVPAFIRKDAARAASRVLALDLADGRVGWALLDDELGTIGDAERGLSFGGSLEARTTAQSVAARLAAGASDERIVTDLQKLGVGYLWVTGASEEQRVTISNAPGLGVAAADERGANWSVPDSGRMVVVQDGAPSKLDPGAPIPAGSAGRLLLLAEPADPALRVTIDGKELARGQDGSGRLAFDVPATGGVPVVVKNTPPPVWAIGSALLLALLLALAAPASASAADARARAPRHASRGRRR